MNVRERTASAEGEVLSLDALRPLNVTDVVEFVFCKRKGAFAAHHIAANQGSPAFALGTIEHEFRHQLFRKLRARYSEFHTPNDVRTFERGDELLDLIIGTSTYLLDLARATHPLYFDKIERHLEDQLAPNLLDEEQERATKFRHLLETGVVAVEAVDRLLPRDIERSLMSSRLRVKGRVDQVWLRDGRAVPVDFKTHGAHLRKLFEECHWIQAALYGLLLQEAGEPVTEVGLHYSYMGRIELRPLDEELRARAIAAVREAREQLLHGGIPPVSANQDKCSVCLHHNRCFGAQKVNELMPPAPPSGVAVVAPSRAVTAQEQAFSALHCGLSRMLRRGSRVSRKDVDQWVKAKRHEVLVELGCTPETKIAVRRLLKAFEKQVAMRLAGGTNDAHQTFFDGTRVEDSTYGGCVHVIKQTSVTPWVYVGVGTSAARDRDVADRCFAAERDTGLHCNGAVRVDGDGYAYTFVFGEEERKRWASQLVSRRAALTDNASDFDLTNDTTTTPTADDSMPPELHLPPRPTYVGRIHEDRTRRLTFSPRGDRVHGFVYEAHRDALAKEDYVVAECVGTDPPDKRIFLRVLELKSAPSSAGTRTKSVNELDTEVLLEPLGEHRAGEDGAVPAVNDDWSGFQIRRATSNEVRTFVRLPEQGLPLGHLAASGEPVAVNFPFEPNDALFRSFFVVGAKGKGKTSFVRSLATLATAYLGSPSGERPAVVILDGEPSQHGDSSEFSPSTFGVAHTRLGEQLGSSLLGRPNVREVTIKRDISGLAFSYGDIKIEDVLLLLPPVTETSANVLRRILKHIPAQQQKALRSLKDVLEHLRNELRTNSQLDQRTARAIAERLMSPQAELLESVAPDAVRVSELLAPGTITVLNVVDLDDDQRKVVALYLLLAFEKLAEYRGIDTLLVLDEAEKLFPRRLGGSATPTTIQRLAGRIGGIARRGRRRRFGMMVCTQSPSDVHGDIVSNCDIKITFNVSGQDAWLRENIGADLVQGVKALGTGECYVDLRKLIGVKTPVRTRLFRS